MEIKFNNAPLGTPHECRVFMPSDPKGFDLSDLRRFGLNIYPLVKTRVIYPDQAEEEENNLPQLINYYLDTMNFNPHKDYVVLIGDPLITAASIFVLGQKVDSITVLRYDSQSRAYWPFKISLKQ